MAAVPAVPHDIGGRPWWRCRNLRRKGPQSAASRGRSRGAARSKLVCVINSTGARRRTSVPGSILGAPQRAQSLTFLWGLSTPEALTQAKSLSLPLTLGLTVLPVTFPVSSHSVAPGHLSLCPVNCIAE